MSQAEAIVNEAWENVKMALKKWKQGITFDTSVIDAIRSYLTALAVVGKPTTYYTVIPAHPTPVAVRMCDLPALLEQKPELIEVLALVWAGV